MTEFKGEEIIKLLGEEKKKHSVAFYSSLSKYDPVDTFMKWHKTIRAIEELINIPQFGVFSDQEKQRLNAISLKFDEFLNNGKDIGWLIGLITQKYGKETAKRFIETLCMISAINQAFLMQGTNTFGNGFNMNTIADAIVYLQSRRRYFVTLLYLIPGICKGKEAIEVRDTINVFLPIIEHNCISLKTMNDQVTLAKIFSDYKLTSDGVKVSGNYYYNYLEDNSAEPERISLLDQLQLRNEQVPKYPYSPPLQTKIFSFQELKNSVNLIKAAFEFFQIKDANYYNLIDFILSLEQFVNEDYFIVINKMQFDNLISKYANSNEIKNLLLNQSADFAIQLNSFHPFINVGDHYSSNVNLLMRFLYYYKNSILNRARRFQVHSGFVFEDKVKQSLKDNKFEITDITRINRKEFDVVTIARTINFATIKEDTIYNFQCKNNAIDLTLVESNQEMFVAFNRKLVKYYEAALEKEKAREDLLINKLGIKHIKHYVISRFPVLTNNERIISFNKLESWIRSEFNS